jgi:acyl carrier protein phosphodiesterase
LHSHTDLAKLTPVNFLAHLYLADPTPASMIGNLLPDMTPGPLAPDLSPDVLAGARNHQRVDAFTDTHPVFARSRSLFRDKHGRLSAILTDLFYDHILARDWTRYHDQPLHDFIDHAHAALAKQYDLMPEPMRPIIGRLIDQGWLRCYATPDGMAVILKMMSHRFSQRLRRPIDLAKAVDDLPEFDSALTDDFAEFFPQLVTYVYATDTCPPTSQPDDETNTTDEAAPTHTNSSTESHPKPALQCDP